MAYAFLPVGFNTREEGCYLQFRRATRASLWSSGLNEDLGILRGSLICRAALSITGESSLARAAYRLNGLGTHSVQRNRWERMGDIKDYYASSSRKNGIVNVCKKEVTGYTPMLDSLLADEFPLWKLIARPKWSLDELEGLEPHIQAMQLSFPPLFVDDFTEAAARWHEIMEARLRWGMPALAFVTTMLFCLRRALVFGSLLDYGVAYYSMVTTMQWVVDGNVTETQWLHMKDPANNGVPLTPPLYARQQQVDRLILTDFWWRFGHMLQNWFSRIRAVNSSSRAFQNQALLLAERLGPHEGLIVSRDSPFAAHFHFVDDSYIESARNEKQSQRSLYIGDAVGSMREYLPRFGSSTLTSSVVGAGAARGGWRDLARWLREPIE